MHNCTDVPTVPTVELRTLGGQRLIADDCELETMVGDLKQRIHQEWNVHPQYQRFILGSEELDDLIDVGGMTAQNNHVDIVVVVEQMPIHNSMLDQLSVCVKHLNNDDSRIRRAAIRALTKQVDIYNQRVLETFTQKLQCEFRVAHVDGKRSIIEALSKIAPKGCESAIRVALGALEDMNEFVRIEAAEAVKSLAPCGDERTILALLTLFRSNRSIIKQAGLMAIGTLSNGLQDERLNRRVDDAINVLLSDPCDNVRESAFEAYRLKLA